MSRKFMNWMRKKFCLKQLTQNLLIMKPWSCYTVRFSHETTVYVHCMFCALSMVYLSLLSCRCKYALDFILQTLKPINEHTSAMKIRLRVCLSMCVCTQGSPCHQADLQGRSAAHYNIGFPLSCHYHTLSLKADPKDRQSIRRQTSHLYLLNVLMTSIFRPTVFAAGYWSRGGDQWCEVLDWMICRS